METDSSRPGLGAVAGGLVGGMLAGYLIGSGIEDTLHYILSTNPPIEYLKTVATFVGMIGGSALGLLQAFNKDRDEGRLVKEEGIEQKGLNSLAIEHKPNLEGLALAFEKLGEGVYNEELVNRAYLATAQKLEHNPFKTARIKWEEERDNFLPNFLKVFNSFEYRGREINPKQTLDNFFATGERLYPIGINSLSEWIGKEVCPERTQQIPSKDFEQTLAQEILLARDIGHWLNYLSRRQGIIGSKVKEKLRQVGVTDPDFLEEDIQRLGKNFREMYAQII